MKQVISILVFLLFSISSLNAQTEDTIKMVKSGDLFEVTIYYENGNVMQHGFLNADNKLQGSWVSYYEDGSKKCVATYENGEKTGVWDYYYNNSVKRVTYKDNKIVKVEELDSIM